MIVKPQFKNNQYLDDNFKVIFCNHFRVQTTMAAPANQQPHFQQRRSPRDHRQQISPEVIEEAACKLFIASLPAPSTEENLKEYFSKYGEVVEASIARDQNTKE
jgi:RNA recognition motif-containing protein